MFGLDDAALALLVAGGLSTAGTLYANAKNRKMQDAWNDASINLANTAHQREVLDLMQAGINPILSAKGSGAAVPTLNAAQVQNPLEGIADGMSSAASYLNDQYKAEASSAKSQAAILDNAHIISDFQTEADLDRIGYENLKNEAIFQAYNQLYANKSEWLKYVDEVRQGIISSAKMASNENWQTNLRTWTGAAADVAKAYGTFKSGGKAQKGLDAMDVLNFFK